MDQVEKGNLLIEYMNTNTPLDFIPFEGQENAIVFERGDMDCYSYLGQMGGHQPIRLSDKCTWQSAVHEIMHALGFFHEHSRADRDRYIKIRWDNIEDKFLAQFTLIPQSLMGFVMSSPFDFESIMLYPSGAFAKNEGLINPKMYNAKRIMIMPPRLRKRSCRAIDTAASRFVRNMVSSRLR